MYGNSEVSKKGAVMLSLSFLTDTVKTTMPLISRELLNTLTTILYQAF